MAKQSAARGAQIDSSRTPEQLAGESFLEFCRRFAAQPGRPPNPAEAQDAMDTLQGDIIPRLMLVHTDRRDIDRQQLIAPEDVDRLRQALLSGTTQHVDELMDQIRGRGVPWNEILVDLLAKVARQLGEDWEEDDLSFAEVSVALCKLHRVLRKFPDDETTPPAPGPMRIETRPSILLATAPGDQHIFGVMMVAEFFRKDGWRVETDPCATAESLSRTLKSHSFDVLGLSVSWDGAFENLPNTLKRLRKVSRNKALQVLMGGPAVARNPVATGACKVDAVISTANEAAATGRSLLAIARTG